MPFSINIAKYSDTPKYLKIPHVPLYSDFSLLFLSCSEAKTCLADKRVAFVGDSRIRQLFYSFVKIIDPERKEDGNKVSIEN